MSDAGIVRATLSQQVTRRLRAEIEARGLRPGEEIPGEGELARRYGVNRLAVREAIRTLVARGILSSSQGRRARVATPSPEVLEDVLGFLLHQERLTIADLLDTRELVEGELARRAARRVAGAEPGTADALAGLAAIHEAMRTSRDREPFIAHDLAFHHGIGELAGGGLLAFVLSALSGPLLEARRASYEGHSRRSGGHAATVEAHRRILDAIAAGDPVGAGAAMAAHLADTRRDLG